MVGFDGSRPFLARDTPMVPLRSRLLALVLLSLVEFVAAAPSPFPSIPPVLAPWIPWVLRDAGDEICPSGRDGRHCEALSVLDMSVRGSTASFVLSGTLWKAGFVELPGDSSLWPEDVKGASGALPAISREQRPAVFLGKGDFHVSGNIRWTRRPASIALPVDVALERLDLEGRMVEAQDGQLWLRRDAEDDRPHEGDSAGSVEMKVYRTVRDGVPVRMEDAAGAFRLGCAPTAGSFRDPAQGEPSPRSCLRPSCPVHARRPVVPDRAAGAVESGRRIRMAGSSRAVPGIPDRRSVARGGGLEFRGGTGDPQRAAFRRSAGGRSPGGGPAGRRDVSRLGIAAWWSLGCQGGPAGRSCDRFRQDEALAFRVGGLRRRWSHRVRSDDGRRAASAAPFRGGSVASGGARRSTAKAWS